MHVLEDSSIYSPVCERIFDYIMCNFVSVMGKNTHLFSSRVSKKIDISLSL